MNDPANGTDFRNDVRKVRINVGGRLFHTTTVTLLSHPGTTLANLAGKDNFSTDNDLELSFDRNPDVFSSVVDYYRTGNLHIPRNVCPQIVRDELSFWNIGEDNMLPCCWGLLYSLTDSEDIIQEAKRMKHSRNKHREESWPLRWKIWRLLDKPRSSRQAKIWHVFYIFLLVTMFLASCFESLTEFRTAVNSEKVARIDQLYNITNPKLRIQLTTSALPYITIYSKLCQLIFTVEFVLRFAVSFDKKKFFKCLINVIDLITIPAMWATFAMEIIPEVSYDHITAYFLIRSLAVLRLIRIFRLAKQFTDLKIMLKSVNSSKSELLLLLTVLAIFSCIFARIEYAVEIVHEQSFPDMYVSLWWSVITMTTVGYGDVTPKTVVGRIVGSICAVSGLLLLSMPVAVISRNFGERYCYQKSKKRRSAWLELNSGKKHSCPVRT